MLPEGQYRARAVQADLAETRNGDPQMVVLFEVTEPGHTGQRIAWYGYFTDKTTARTFEALRYCGWRGDDLQHLDGIGEHEVVLVVEHEAGQDGKTRARVRWVNRIGGGLSIKAPMNNAKRRAFAAKMKAAAVASRSVIPPAAAERVPGEDDDDLAF